MAHELTTRKTGKTEMAWVGETPWHGLGQQLQVGASIETWAEAAGMDWKVGRSKVRYSTERDGDWMRIMDDRHVLFRSDTKEALSVVSDDYKIVQPREMLEFFRDLVGESGYQLHTAGTLFGGKRFWALAKVSEANVVGQDKVGGYLLLSSSCDGSMKTEARETTVRVVCNNTLSMARGSAARIAIGHRSEFDHDAVKKQLGLSREHFETFMASARALSRVKMTNAAAENFVKTLLRKMVTVDGKQERSERRHPGEDVILNLFSSSAMGGTLAGAEGSAWGLVNAVTEFVDHKASAKSTDHRLVRAWFHGGDDLKTEAFNQALALV